ncbi:sensor domain-containing protein [Streptomyces gelaticus]|uniref:sensor domain-containing protein n=1 Tax=Streptomyces gelaticus TaxID=285446 RepID=UPI0037BB7733
MIAVRWRPSAGVAVRVGRQGRRTLVESLYLLTAPLSACFCWSVACVSERSAPCCRAVRPSRPGRRHRRGDPAIWSGGGSARSVPWRAGRGAQAGGRAGGAPDAACLGLWPDLAHAVLVLPVVLITWVVTALWWFVGVATTTYPLRSRVTPGSLRPMTLYAGSEQSHIALRLGLTSPADRLAFALMVGALLLLTLPLVTRVCVAAQAGLGQALLSHTSALHRRISGQERGTVPARAVTAVTAEADALRRLERDIHDGPQQQLVRLHGGHDGLRPPRNLRLGAATAQATASATGVGPAVSSRMRRRMPGWRTSSARTGAMSSPIRPECRSSTLRSQHGTGDQGC